MKKEVNNFGILRYQINILESINEGISEIMETFSSLSEARLSFHNYPDNFEANLINTFYIVDLTNLNTNNLTKETWKPCVLDSNKKKVKLNSFKERVVYQYVLFRHDKNKQNHVINQYNNLDSALLALDEANMTLKQHQDDAFYIADLKKFIGRDIDDLQLLIHKI